MIVSCNKCNKNFNLDNRLISENGRLLKCGNCNNEWFYIPNSKSDFNFQQPEKNTKIENSVKEKPLKSNIPISDTKNYKKNELENIAKEKKVDKSKYILNNILIFIITFVAILILFDSFKFNLSKLFPNIIPILNSLYESLYDLNLFLKDLFN